MNFKEKLASKLRYLLTLLAMCVLLIGVAYIFFLRSYDIDVMADIEILYTGESGYASAEVISRADNLNQRTQDFLDSVVYKVSPDSNLANGDTIRITATWDEELASTYHFNPVNTSMSVTVNGLYNRYAAAAGIPQDVLDEADEAALKYVRSQVRTVFDTYISQPVNAAMETSITPLYTGFVHSHSSQISDSLVYLYRLDFDNVSQSYSLFYLVTVPDVNDSGALDTKEIYGEKAYLSNTEISREAYEQYILRIFPESRVETLYVKELEPEEDSEKETEEETPQEDSGENETAEEQS